MNRRLYPERPREFAIPIHAERPGSDRGGEDQEEVVLLESLKEEGETERARASRMAEEVREEANILARSSEEEDPFAEASKPPRPGTMQRLAKWAGGVIGLGNIARILGGAYVEGAQAMEEKESAAERAVEVAGSNTFEPGEMRVEIKDELSPQEHDRAVQAFETLFGNIDPSSHPESVFPEGSLGYRVLSTLTSTGAEGVRDLSFSREDVRVFADGMYALYTDKEGANSIGAIEDLCGERIAPGPASFETVHLDALKCYDAYGDAHRLGPPEEIKPFIAIGNGLTLEQLQEHRSLVSSAIVENSGQVDAYLYTDGTFPEGTSVFSHEKDAKYFGRHTFETTIAMATWMVTDGNYTDAPLGEREGIKAAFTAMVHAQIEQQMAWYNLGVDAYGVSYKGEAERFASERLQTKTASHFLASQQQTVHAWQALAAHEVRSDGPIHQTARLQEHREERRLEAFLGAVEGFDEGGIFAEAIGPREEQKGELAKRD